MKVVKSHEMREIDRYTIEQLGIPGIVLMENAAMSIVSETIQTVRKSNKIVICCGIGNNGGDGFAIGRILQCNHKNVSIVIIGDSSKIKGDAKINYDIAKNLNMDIFEYNNDEDTERLIAILNSGEVIYDAIFGTGLTREVTGVFREAIHAINRTEAFKIAVDTPSGLNVDTGQILGTAVHANKTITFCLPKVGLLLYPGAEYVGELVVSDIGIPGESIDRIHTGLNIMDDHSSKLYMPERKPMSHKGTYGKILVIAGTRNMAGAAVMTTLAAYRSGAGLVKTFTEETIASVVTTSVPEAITETFNKKAKSLLEEDRQKLYAMLEWADTVAIGPGLGNDAITREMLEVLITSFDKNIVIDADGINALSSNLDLLNARKGEIIVTPHIGEMARLTNYDINAISSNTIQFAETFSKRYNVTCVLKSARTIVASPTGVTTINIYGNAGMATAGSGDVLTGIIVSLLAQGLKASEAAALGVYIHSKAGDKAKKSLGEYGLMANDMIEQIPYVMKSGCSE